MNYIHFFDKYLRPFFGLLIVLNLIHQVFSSGTTIIDFSLFENFYKISMLLFVVELCLRFYLERKLTFLSTLDAIVLINYYFVGILDFRMLRLFRAYSSFSNHEILLPSNILIKTVYKQRYALLGSQIMVVSVLLVFSTLIHFLEKDIYPEAFGSILSSMWYGITTLTTVGGGITPVTSLGKLLASLTMFLGIGIFALPVAILASAYYEEIQKRNFLISLETISSIPLFEKLPVGAIGKINSKLQAALLPAGKKIITKGDNADAMYIIEFGSVKVELSDPITLGPGDYFGERGLLKNEVRNASITSAQEVKLLKLKKEDLLELISEHAHLFEELSAVSETRSG
ncbi:MAG: cyclic nucleotide-binding domain-containing protein [Rhodobacteraceae bacterium]|nr:cyclic nucleotide-binding domain-containing protein [Paracoccaceae bacterium]